MTSFSQALGAFSFADEDGVTVMRGPAPEGWGQGRTLYGGMTAALALHAAIGAGRAEAPLRSALVAFIGPAEGMLEARAQVLRRGRNVSFVNVDLSAANRLAARCVFAFGAARQSMFDHAFAAPPAGLPGPATARPIMRNSGPGIAQRFEVRLARGEKPFSGGPPDHALWVRHKDERAQGPAALLALADMPPPAILPMFTAPAPISSMTWHINFLEASTRSAADWLLLDTRAEVARDGYSSQDMFIWDEAGAMVCAGRQSVAIFA